MTINFKVGKFWTHLCLIWSRSLTTAQSTAIPANIFFRYAGSGKKEVEELESYYLNLMFRLLWSKIFYIKNIFRKTFSFYSIWFVYIKMLWKIIFQCLFCHKMKKKKKKKLFLKTRRAFGFAFSPHAFAFFVSKCLLWTMQLGLWTVTYTVHARGLHYTRDIMHYSQDPQLFY